MPYYRFAARGLTSHGAAAFSTASDRMDSDLQSIATDLRELHAELESDIAERREKRRPSDDVKRSPTERGQ